jgi:WD40 repeat protein
VSPEEQQLCQGRPEKLAHLLPDPRLLDDLESVLHPADGHTPTVAVFTMQEFANVVGLPNPTLSYDDMADEYAPTIWRILSGLYQVATSRGRLRFQHIPNRRPERRQRRQRFAQRRARIEHLQAEGPLLHYENEKKGMFAVSEPCLAPNFAGNGFFVASERTGLRELTPPWSGERLELDIGNLPERLCLSPSGRYMALATSGASGGIEVWDVKSSQRLFDVESYANSDFDFSRDERKVLSIGDEELLVFETTSGKQLHRLRIAQGAYSACFDPTNQGVVVSDYQDLAHYDLGSGRRLRRWVLGEPRDFSVMAEALQEEIHDSMMGIGPEEAERHLRRVNKYMKFSEDQFAEMMGELREAQQGLLAELESQEWMEEHSTCGSDDARRVAFHPNGQWLFCSTSRGVHVYDWDGFLNRSEPIETTAGTAGDKHSPPPPLFSAQGEPYCEEGEEEYHQDEDMEESDVDAIAFDSGGDCLLFAGEGGVIGSLDLRSGESKTLVEIPGRPIIRGIALTRDRSALACTTYPQLHRDSPKLTPEVYVWDYQTLVEQG